MPEPDVLSLGEFRRLTKDLPDDILIVPRFDDPPADHEPGVTLHRFSIEHETFSDDAGPTTVVAAHVSLFYLNELDDTLDEQADEEEYDAPRICDECSEVIPDTFLGSLANSWHAKSCSLYVDPEIPDDAEG